jgi:hypothetical protein
MREPCSTYHRFPMVQSTPPHDRIDDAPAALSEGPIALVTARWSEGFDPEPTGSARCR